MKSICSVAILCLLFACSSPQPTTMTSTSAHQAMTEPADSIVYYRTTVEVEQKDLLEKMLGNWLLQTMQRQNRLPEETLNIYLRLNKDHTFVANTACGEMKGTYSVKGMSIKFNTASYGRTNCPDSEKLDEMVRLLTSTVSMYTVNGNMMTLRDNSSNSVFRATR